METVTMFKSRQKYHFSKGDKFNVMRNINGDCVVLRLNGEINFIMSEKRLRSYGHLTGMQELGG